MSVDSKVIAAISSAVGLFFEAEQAASPAQGQSGRHAQGPPAAGNQFALAGRQAAMHVRWLWQMRLPR